MEILKKLSGSKYIGIGYRAFISLHLNPMHWHIVDLNLDIPIEETLVVKNVRVRLEISVLCLSARIGYKLNTIYKCKHEPEFRTNVDGIEGCRKCYKIFKPEKNENRI